MHSRKRNLRGRLLVGLLCTVAACSFFLPSKAAAEDSSKFRFGEIDDKSIGLWEGDQPVFVYRFGEMSLPNNWAAGTRSSYLHPIYGLDGEVLTDDFPADHYHHHGLFWGWPHVTIGGRQYDLWKMRGIRIDFQRWLARDDAGDHAKLGVENAWIVRDKKVMNEEAWFDIHPATNDGRVIDITLRWTPTDTPITLGGAEGKSYGGLSLRFAPRTDTVIVGPDGPTKEDLLITKLPWADLSAKFPKPDSPPVHSGAALFVHHDHPDFPPEWMTRGYGLLAIGWPGIKPKTLQPGKELTLRYRLWIHRGGASPAAIKQAYEEFAGR